MITTNKRIMDMRFVGAEWQWTTKDDKQLHIQDMETSHILNCMKMLEKKGFTAITVESGGFDPEDWYYGEYERDFTQVYNNMVLELRLRKQEPTQIKD